MIDRKIPGGSGGDVGPRRSMHAPNVGVPAAACQQGTGRHTHPEGGRKPVGLERMFALTKCLPEQYVVNSL